MTKIELELISDVDMYLFIEKGMRGGIFYIAERFSKSNNIYMQSYDDKKPNQNITYLDANNLYGWAMSQYFPCDEFKWLKQNGTEKSCLNSISENISISYILEIDFKYPDELHELHNDYPLAPKKLEISHNMLLNY